MSKLRLALAVLAVMLALAIGIFLGVVGPRFVRWNSGPQFYSGPALLQQVRTLSHLVTVQYIIEKVVIEDDVKWFGENRVLLVAHGIVKAGIDFSQIKPDDLRVVGKKVIIKLPRAQITDTYLDDKQTKVIERTTGLLRSFDKDLEQNARENAVASIRLAAHDNGILKDADERARDQLKSLFTQMGYEVEFASP
jgi:Protein of unknown function (DUF4230)